MTDGVGRARQPQGVESRKNAGPAGEVKSGAATSFDQVMAQGPPKPPAPDPELAKIKDALDLPLERQVERMPLGERLGQKRELVTALHDADREQKVQYFATRILGAHEGATRLESMQPGIRVPELQHKFVSRLDEVSKECNWMDGVLKDLQGGKEFSMQELLTLQIRCHQVTQSVELLTKSVEHGVGGLKQIYQTNV